MPDFKNNKGYGILPVIAVSALVLTGAYFGYNLYNQNSIVNRNESNDLASEAKFDENSDVLQAAAKPKTPVFNPNDLPIRWRFDEPESNGSNERIYIYFTGKDINKLNNLMEKIKSQNFVYVAIGSKPCSLDGLNFVSTTAKAKVDKFLDDFYSVTIEFPNIRSQNPTCMGPRANSYFFIPGYEKEFVKAPINQATWKNPRPYSQIFPSTSPKSSVSKSSAAPTPAAPVKPFVDVSKLIPSQKD